MRLTRVVSVNLWEQKEKKHKKEKKSKKEKRR